MFAKLVVIFLIIAFVCSYAFGDDISQKDIRTKNITKIAKKLTHSLESVIQNHINKQAFTDSKLRGSIQSLDEVIEAHLAEVNTIAVPLFRAGKPFGDSIPNTFKYFFQLTLLAADSSAATEVQLSHDGHLAYAEYLYNKWRETGTLKQFGCTSYVFADPEYRAIQGGLSISLCKADLHYTHNTLLETKTSEDVEFLTGLPPIDFGTSLQKYARKRGAEELYTQNCGGCNIAFNLVLPVKIVPPVSGSKKQLVLPTDDGPASDEFFNGPVTDDQVWTFPLVVVAEQPQA